METTTNLLLLGQANQKIYRCLSCKKQFAENELAKSISNSTVTYRCLKCNGFIELPQTYAKQINQKAMDILKDPNLINILIQEVGRFAVGEETTILTAILNTGGRLVTNCDPTSYNTAANADPGTGKDFVLKTVLATVVPKDKLIIKTRISPTVLNYWHTKDTDPDWTWDGKVLLLIDISNAVLNSEVFKCFLSDGSEVTVVKDQKAIDIKIEGKPVVFCTMAMSLPNQEMLRRLNILQLDTSREQTRAISEARGRKESTGTIVERNQLIQEAMTGLDRISVVIPYAEKIQAYFPDDLIVRTKLGTFFDFIKTSTAFHQFQREKNKNGFIIANAQDYEYARIAFMKFTSDRGLIPLTHKQKKVLDVIDKELDKNDGSRLIPIHNLWAVSEIEARANVSHKGLYDILDRLVDAGLLDKKDKEISVYESKSDSGNRINTKLVMAYKIRDQMKFNLPTKEEIQMVIDTPDD
jgi:DNA-directed RNA polymerase subunit RPC12/RpoP/DNA-binding MarR family transcriptional regulator